MKSPNHSHKIEVKNLKTVLGGKVVHKDVNLTVQEGETMLVIGGSGCGKSVLFKNIVGLLKPESGSIYIDGVDITQTTEKEMMEIRKKFGVLFQGAALFDSMTVKENVGFALKRETELTDNQIDLIVKEKLKQVGLVGVQDMRPSELSGGMQKRVGLARAIAMDPEIILYDEPTTGLDPIMADIINDLILQLQRELKVTSIVVTHDMKSAFKVGNSIAMLHEGTIIFTGTIQEIKQTKNLYIKQFIEGSSDELI